MAPFSTLAAIILLAVTPWALAADPLRVAVFDSNEFWPMVGSEGGKATGFEPALANTICATLNTTCTFVPVETLPARFVAANTGAADFAISVITVTEERAKLVDFVKPYYYDAGVTVFSVADADLAAGGWDALRGRTVCSQEGYYANDLLPEAYGINVKVLIWTDTTTDDEKMEELAAAIDDGTCVGFLSDSTSAEAFGLSNSQLPALAVEPYGIVVAKGNEALRRELSAALVEAMGSGADSAIFDLERREVVANGVPANGQLPAVVAAISDFDTAGTAPAPTPAPVPPPLPSGAAAVKAALAAVVCALGAAAMA